MASISERILPAFKNQESEAGAELWRRTIADVIAIATKYVNRKSMSRRFADEDDIASNVFIRLQEMANSNQLDGVNDRESLMALLTTIVLGKVTDLQRYMLSPKRGGGAVRGESAFSCSEDSRSQGGGISRFPGGVLTAEQQMRAEESIESALAALPDSEVRMIAEKWLAGYRQVEIVDQFNLSKATVSRRIQLIISIWQTELVQDEA